MESYQEDTYGDRIAGIYDEWYTKYDDAMIETLVELAQGGRALELGIGTGRIALPLQHKGITVHGIDASPAMIAKLRGKPNGDRIQVTLGNFADVAVDGQYALIYVVFNTFFSLLTQDEQVRCIGNVAKRLKLAGNFVVEAFMPDLSRFSGQQALRVVNIGENEVRLDASQIDPVTQQITSQHVLLTEEGIRFYPVKLRYVWPTEFDLMARLAGLRLKYRWENWHKSDFEIDSGKHISVYEHIQ
jgi:SAM-dependent methyltransferase